MEVDQPPSTTTKRLRDGSMTIEDERTFLCIQGIPTTDPNLACASPASTPAVQPPSRSRAASTATVPATLRLRQSMTQIITLLNQSKHADIFRRPVTTKEAPDYAKAVRKPTDLTAIQRAAKAGQYRTWDELERDLRRMLANCCVFNKPGTEAYDSAKQVRIVMNGC